MADRIAIDRMSIRVGDKVFLESKEYNSEVSGRVAEVTHSENRNITTVLLSLFGTVGEQVSFNVGPLSAYSLKDIERPKPVLPTEPGTRISANVHGHEERGDPLEIDDLILIRLYPGGNWNQDGDRWTDLHGRIWADNQIAGWEEV